MSFGANTDGQLGLGDDIARNVPTLIPNLNDVKEISSGNRHLILSLSNIFKIYLLI